MDTLSKSSNSLAALWKRARALWALRRTDGRLPQAIGDLLHTWMRLRVRHTANTAKSLLRRPWFPVRGLEMSAGRWWEVAGSPPRSLHDLKHVYAARVVDALTAAGIQPFLIEDSDSNLCFGIRVEDRPDAWRALIPIGNELGWYVDWRWGRRSGTKRIRGRRLPRSLARSEWWRIYRAYRTGYRSLAGREEAVELSFWALGSSGELERVAIRGHHRFPPDTARTTETIDGRTYPGIASYPVELLLTRSRGPIDAVYTWVDGSDPAWRDQFNRWAPGGAKADWDALEPRYRSRDELRYSLRSLWLNAGWIRHVYLVTAGQVPDWLVPDDRLSIVDHSEIFPEQWLPSFNSHAIEARLHHVEGLAEQFIYFNDDVFLGRAVHPGAFFTPNGLSLFFEADARVPMPNTRAAALPVNTAALKGQRLIRETFGRVIDRKLHHGPHALLRSVLYEIEERFPDVMEQTARSRFRDPDDLSVASAFAHHYGFCTGRAIPGQLKVAYQNLEARRLSIFLERVLLGRDLDCFCLNDTEAPQKDPVDTDATVSRFLDSYFSVPSLWEKK